MSGTTVRNTNIRIGYDDQDARGKLEALGTLGEQVFARINRAVQSGGPAYTARAADIQAYGQSLDALRARIDPLFAASKRYEGLLEEIAHAEQVGAVNARTAAAARERVTAQYQASIAPMQAASVAQDRLGVTQDRVGVSAGNAAFAMRQLGVQSIQAFSGIASGQPILTTFVQQGHQVVDVAISTGSGFGLVAEAAKKVAAAVFSLPGLLIGTGVAMGALLLRAASAESQMRAFNLALEGAGKSGSISAAQLADYTKVLQAHGVAQQAATKIITDAARANGASATSLAQLAHSAADLAAATGTDVAAAAKVLSDMAGAPYEAIAKLDRQINFLTRDQLAAIRAMAEQGQQAQAAGVAMAALQNRIGGLAEKGLSPAAKAVGNLKDAWSDFITGIANSKPVLVELEGLSLLLKDIGDAGSYLSRAFGGGSTADKIAALQELSKAYEAGTARFGPSSAPANEAARIRQQIADLKARQMMEGGPITGGAAAALPGAGVTYADMDDQQRQLKIVDDLTSKLPLLNKLLEANAADRAKITAAAQADDLIREKGLTGMAAEELKRRLIAEAIAKQKLALEDSVKSQADAAKRRQAVIDGLAAELTAAQASTAGIQAGTEAAHQMALALEIEAKDRAAGIPVVEKRTDADKKAAATIADYVTKLDALKQANAAAEKAAAQQQAAQKKLDEQATRTTDSIVRYAGDKFADLFTATGRGWSGLMDSLKQTAIATFARIAAEALIRPIVMPIVASLVGSTGTASAAGIAGSLTGGGSGIFGNLSSLLGLSNLGSSLGLPSIGSMLGLTGSGGGLSGLLGTTLWGGSVIPDTYGAAGQLITGGAFGGTTLGSLLGGAGLGFAGGSLLNTLLGGHQLGGSIGSGIGGLAGAAIGSIIPGIGTVLGGLIGGLAGGGLGGLFGPKPSDHTAVGKYNLATGEIYQSNGPKETSQTQSGRQQALTAMQQAYQALAAQVGSTSNAAIRLQVGTRDGTKLFFDQNGQTTKTITGVGDIQGVVDAFKKDIVGAFQDAAGDVKTVLDASTGSYDKALAGLTFLNNTYKSLTDTTPALNAYAASLKAINDSYAAAEAQAAQYGLSVAKLTDAQAAAVAKLNTDRDAQAQSITDTLRVRLLGDSGDAQGAALASFDLQASQQEKALKDQIEALGLSGTQYAADRIVEIEKALAQERLSIEKQYAAASSQTAQSLLSSLAFGSGSALNPSQQYFAALATLNSAGTSLASGGSLSDYTSVAQQVLPVARQYLGTSQRYASLVADVASTVSAAGGDPAGLGSLLASQVDSTDQQTALLASIANKQLDAANATVTELKRLASVLEALISRRLAG